MCFPVKPTCAFLLVLFLGCIYMIVKNTVKIYFRGFFCAREERAVSFSHNYREFETQSARGSIFG